VLLSDVINGHPKMRQQSLTVTEQRIVLVCERCRESTTGADAELVQEAAVLVYRCPRDGATLATVEGGEGAASGGGWSFHEGRLAIKLGGEAIDWEDLMLSLDELDD
jgi:hypothetical protein